MRRQVPELKKSLNALNGLVLSVAATSVHRDTAFLLERAADSARPRCADRVASRGYDRRGQDDDGSGATAIRVRDASASSSRLPVDERPALGRLGESTNHT
jgi:hypothetical protein